MILACSSLDDDCVDDENNVDDDDDDDGDDCGNSKPKHNSYKSVEFVVTTLDDSCLQRLFIRC